MYEFRAANASGREFGRLKPPRSHCTEYILQISVRLNKFRPFPPSLSLSAPAIPYLYNDAENIHLCAFTGVL